MRFPSQEHWSGLSFPTPGNLPDPGIEPTSPTLAGRFFTTESPGKPQEKYIQYFKKYIWNLTKTRISIKKKNPYVNSFLSQCWQWNKEQRQTNKKIHRNENDNHETRKWLPHSKKGCVPLKNGRVESADPFRMEVSGTHNQTQLWLTTKMNWSLGYSQGCVICYWNFKNCYTDLYINHLWVYLMWVEAFPCPNHLLIYEWIFLWTLAKTLKSHKCNVVDVLWCLK